MKKLIMGSDESSSDEDNNISNKKRQTSNYKKTNDTFEKIYQQTIQSYLLTSNSCLTRMTMIRSKKIYQQVHHYYHLLNY